MHTRAESDTCTPRDTHSNTHVLPSLSERNLDTDPDHPKPCCEAVLTNLEKYCYSFKPPGDVTKVPDPSHWDGGVWKLPASFDRLCDEFEPYQCKGSTCGKSPCPKVLSLLARRFHPHICDAVKVCPDFCDNQCKTWSCPRGMSPKDPRRPELGCIADTQRPGFMKSIAAAEQRAV